MIVVDASAVLAIHLAEAERAAFSTRIIATVSIMSPVTAWEVLARAFAIDGEIGSAKAQQLIETLGIEVVPIDFGAALQAAEAFKRFGKRTPAALNLGDCFAYALAKQRNAPLLYKGDDFAKTDIEAA